MSSPWQLPLIRSLLLHRRPAAVVRLVVAIVVNPFQGQFPWAFTHVVQEGSKRTPPAFAHANTASTVPVIFRIICVVATILRRNPRDVRFASMPPPIVTMPCVRRFRPISSIAAATFCAAATKKRSFDRYVRPTFAETLPTTSPCNRDLAQRQESAEVLSSKIWADMHNRSVVNLLCVV